VIGSLDLLSMPDVNADADLSLEMAGLAGRQARRLQRLIDDLLVASKMDRGLVQPRKEPVQVGDVVKESVALIAYENVTVAMPDGVWAMADPHHLTQIVINLVENAIKYAPGSQIDVIGANLGDDKIMLAVSDHGPGIPGDLKDKIFERFYRLPGSDRASGTGLGLSIVFMLVESMGGVIDVVDTPGGGATFALTLPAATASEMGQRQAA
jgi:two-component system sensor histidine kinase KdpD